MFLSDMGVPGAQGARAGMVGPQGQNAGNMGAHRLTGLISRLAFVPRLDHPYIVPQWRYYLSGGDRHVLDAGDGVGGTNLAAGGSVAGDIMMTTDVGQNPRAAPGMGNVVSSSLKAMHTMTVQINSWLRGCRAP